MLSMFAILTALTQQEMSAEAIYERTTPSVLTLRIERANNSEGIGTAFLALRPGLAVTAWHVVKDASKITGKFSDGKEAAVVGVIDKDETLDLALVAVDSGDRPVLSIAEGDPKVGAKTYVIGTPRGLEFSISDGIISQTPYFGDSKLYQFTCPVSQGNSGGPLLNAAGQVLGVVSWQLRDAQNLNFAVPISWTAKLDANKAPQPIPVATAPGTTWPDVFRSVSDPLLTQVIRGCQLSAEPVDDGTGATSFLIDCDGTKVSLFQYTKDQRPGPAANIALSTGFEGTGKVDLTALNDFNRSHRFVRTYVDESGVVYLENDLDAEGGIGVRTLGRFVDDYRRNLSQFMHELFGKEKAHSEQSQFMPKSAPFDEKELGSILEECGYKSQTADDGTGKMKYSFTVDSREVSLYQYTDRADNDPTTSLTLMSNYDAQGRADVGLANLYNLRARYSKAFLDSNGNACLVADLDLAGGVTKDSVRNFVARFVKAVPSFVSLFKNGH